MSKKSSPSSGLHRLALSVIMISSAVGTSACLKKSSTVKAAAAEIDKSKYPAVSDQKVALANVGKRILGADPTQANDPPSGIGLMNVADAMGYKYAFNSCNKAIEVLDDVPTLRVNHINGNTGEGRCDQVSREAWVSYKFSDWRIKTEGVEKLTPNLTDTVPSPTRGQGGTLGTPTVAVNQATGRLEVITPDVVKATGSSNTTAPTKFTLSYKGGVAKNKSAGISTSTSETSSVTASFSVSLKSPNVEGTASVGFSYGTSRSQDTTSGTSDTTTKEVSCAAEVSQPAGCQYEATLSAMHKVSKGSYRAYLSAIPQMVEVKGMLSDIQYCYKTGYIQSSGVCKYGINAATFGGPGAGAKNFVEHMRELVTSPSDDEHWLWSKIVADSNQQKDGKSYLQLAVDSWGNYDFSRFQLDFYDVDEVVTECKVEVKSLNNNPGCTATQAPAVSASGVTPDGAAGASPQAPAPAQASEQAPAQASEQAPAAPNAASGIAPCVNNGGKGFGTAFSCAAGTCAKDDGTTYADSSICSVK